MLKHFLNFIQKENLFQKEDAILLAVSGGVDSVVMCDLFAKANFKFGIAHCNFNLRGEESDNDQKLVSALAKKYKVRFWKKTFQTEKYAARQKISIQMAARDLRYGWFENLAEKENFSYIASAHHLDDSIETFFINILRGTGIAGLQGVPIKKGKIIRPLLFANKKMIREFARQESLAWQEDSSNSDDKYLRNAIRHNLIPSLKKLNTGFEKTITKELSYFKDAASIFKTFIEEKKQQIVVQEGKDILLNIKKLKESGHAETILHELLRAYDFTPETTELIAKRMYSTAGKKFFSPTYRLIKDRHFLVLSPFGKEKKEDALTIAMGQKEVEGSGIHLDIKTLAGGLHKIKDKKNSVAYFDYESISFPLSLRKWRHGDSFHPFGMKGKKKISDLLIDNKVSLSNKEDVYVIESKGQIIWVVGYRQSELYKVHKGTKKILKLTSLQ